VTTSDETNDLAHPAIRRLVHEANALPLADRLALLNGHIPGSAREMPLGDFESLAAELRLKGERFSEATAHPGEGRSTRQVIGERDFEGR
jgi:hypothetical protein